MSEAQDTIDRLDASLAAHGTGPITITRGVTTATVNARCRAARAEEIVSRGASAQIIYKGIISATGLGALGVLKRNDKVLHEGVEKTVLYAAPARIGETLVRVDFEFAG